VFTLPVAAGALAEALLEALLDAAAKRKKT